MPDQEPGTNSLNYLTVIVTVVSGLQSFAVVMVSHDIESAVEYASHILHLQETVLYFGKADGYEKSRAGKTFLGGETHV